MPSLAPLACSATQIQNTGFRASRAARKIEAYNQRLKKKDFTVRWEPGRRGDNANLNPPYLFATWQFRASEVHPPRMPVRYAGCMPPIFAATCHCHHRGGGEVLCGRTAGAAVETSAHGSLYTAFRLPAWPADRAASKHRHKYEIFSQFNSCIPHSTSNDDGDATTPRCCN